MLRVLILLILLGGMGWALVGFTDPAVYPADNGGFAHRQSTDALIASCGPEYTFPDVLKESGIVPEYGRNGVPRRVSYQTIVPIFGGFWATPAASDQTYWSRNEPGIPQPENLLLNMWRGAMVVYYDQDAKAADLKGLQRLVADRSLDILVVPWDPSRQPLPMGRTYAFATWDWSQTCHELSISALTDFRHEHPVSAAPGANGTKPPVARKVP